MNRPDPLDRLLDQVDAPPLPADFAERVAAQASAAPQITGGRPVRDRRGPWARRHRTLATFIAANLLVASAVAAAIVSGQGIEPLRKVPLIAPVIERIAPKHKHEAHIAMRQAMPAPRPTASASPAPAPEANPLPEPMPVRAQQLFARRAALAAIVERREAAGLPVPPRLRKRVELQQLQREAVEHRMAGQQVPPALRRRIVADRLAVAPPAVRRRVMAEVRARRAAGQKVPPLRQLLQDARRPEAADTPYAGPGVAAPFDRPFPSFEEWRAQRRDRMRQYLQDLAPEQRRQLMQERRARRMQANPELQEGGPPQR